MNPQTIEIPDSRTQMGLAVSAALAKKAIDLKVLDLAAISDFTDRFLVFSGSNDRQVQTIAEAVIGSLREAGVRPLHVEGLERGAWVLIDYGGELVVHVFRDETRRFYDLERLWADAPDLTASFVEPGGD